MVTIRDTASTANAPMFILPLRRLLRQVRNTGYYPVISAPTLEHFLVAYGRQEEQPRVATGRQEDVVVVDI